MNVLLYNKVRDWFCHTIYVASHVLIVFEEPNQMQLPPSNSDPDERKTFFKFFFHYVEEVLYQVPLNN